jgi:DNA processing protein
MGVKRLPDEEALALLALARCAGIGPLRGAALLEACGGAVRAVACGHAKGWPALPGLKAGAAEVIGLKVSLAGAAEECERAARVGAQLMVFGRPPYPPRWHPQAGFPLALWWRGVWPPELERSPAAALAIVGPRRVSEPAERFAGALAERCAHAGAVVVSGLAYGVDAAAHRGALRAQAEGARVGTVAVLASGVDSPTPHAHRSLARAILDAGGALISSAAIGARPLPGSFPERNHSIAGFASAVAVVEAGIKSGSLHTARSANDLGLPVGTTPSRAWDAHAAGSLALLRDGATALLAPDDGWRLLPPGVLERSPAELPPLPATVWAAHLARGPQPAAALAAASGEPLQEVIAALEMGVLEGWLGVLDDGRYRLSEPLQAPIRGPVQARHAIMQ